MLYSIRSYNRLNASETGILDIRVSDNRNRPISKAFVSIAKISYTGQYNESAEGIVIAELYTDNNGIVHIELPVLNELIGSNEFYSASISDEGYYNAYIYYIQIWPNMAASYEVGLTPRISGVERFKFIFQPQKGTIHEH